MVKLYLKKFLNERGGEGNVRRLRRDWRVKNGLSLGTKLFGYYECSGCVERGMEDGENFKQEELGVVGAICCV